MKNQISLKTIVEHTYPDKMKVIDYYEENDITRICYHFTIYPKPYEDLSSQYTTIIGKEDKFYHENEKEAYQPELLAKLEAKSLRQTVKEKVEITRPGWKATTYYYKLED